MSYLNTFQDIRIKETAILIKSGGKYTITPANPSANRVLNIIDPGGTDDFLFAAASQILTNKTLGGDLNANSHKITNLTDPGSAQDAATKAYVDAAIQGLDVHEGARVGTTTNLTGATYSSGTKKITNGSNGALTIDGVTMNNNDRVLVKDQTTATENGIYTVFDKGSAGTPWVLLRATDADTSAEFENAMFIFVGEGTSNAGTGWVLTSADTITLDTTDITWTQFSTAGTIVAGDGLTKTGNTIDVVGTTNRIDVAADSIDISASYVGQTSITTLGTIATGTWSATTIAVNKGGTGATNASGARANLSAAPNDATYYTTSSNSELTNEVVLTNGTGITLSAGTIAVDTAVVATTSNSLTMTNKTLTSPVITTPTITNSVVAKTANYTMSAGEHTVEVDTSGGAVAITLPQATSGNKGKVYRIRKMTADGNAVTVQATSCNVVGSTGGTTIDIEYQYDSLDVESNGSNYYAC